MEVYFIASVIFIFADLLSAAGCLRDKTRAGKDIGAACVFAAVATLCYLCAVSVSSVPSYSWFTSFHLVASDAMLMWLLYGVCAFTGISDYPRVSEVLRILLGLFGLDVLFVLTNPIHHLAVTFVPRSHGFNFAMFDHVKLPMYYVHLALNYLVPVLIVAVMIHVIIRAPLFYKFQYLMVILGVLLATVLNMSFLFLPEDSVYTLLDLSKPSYSIAAILLYAGLFRYRSGGMLGRFKSYAFENARQGLVVFDLNGRCVLINNRAGEILPENAQEDKMRLERFIEVCGMDPEACAGEEMHTRCFFDSMSEGSSCTCDMNVMRDHRGSVVARLFNFSEEAEDIDALTGFTKIGAFRDALSEGRLHLVYPMTACVCDINGLMFLNDREGVTEGDRKIIELATLMKTAFPPRTYFIRGQEAALIAVCRNMPGEKAETILAGIKETFGGDMEYAFDICADETGSILTSILNAKHAMRIKKLLNNKSSRYEMLATLIKALQECDLDTEEHVQRTRDMGTKLGRRIGLTDVQISDLQLLCLLHDIGKIGVPLDILNKPGRLTENEWRTIKQHTVKGYEIAISQQDMGAIAQMILHHHERWDGKGYPDGLAGEDIPILSRIIAVVDSYDAMTHDRSYRKAMSVSDAIAEVKHCAGAQFDPMIAEAFVELLEEEGDDTVSEIAGSGDVIRPASADVLDVAAEDSRFVHSMEYTRLILNPAKDIVSVDAAFTFLTGYSAEEAMKLNLIDLIPENDREDYLRITTAKIKKDARAYMEHRLRRRDGSILTVICFGDDYYDSAEHEGRTSVIMSDIGTTFAMQSMRVGCVEQMHTAMDSIPDEERDPLTGLPGWNTFAASLRTVLASGKQKVLLMLLDLDNFSSFVAEKGRKAGNDYLMLTGDTLSSSLRQDDPVCRMGGDEFGALMCFNEGEGEELIRRRVQQIYNRLGLILSAGNFTGISAGAVISHPGDTVETLTMLAQRALVNSKGTGRGRLTVADRIDEAS